MAGRSKLNAEERQFFALVAQAAFSNPFSDRRLELDRQMAETSPSLGDELAVERAIARVRDRVGELERVGRADLRRFAGEDRAHLHNALLFDVFHQFIGDFDRLIERQIAEGDTPCPTPFARSALELLVRRGYSDEEARRYFGFFFQMRRAFFFITRDLPGPSAGMRALRRRLWNNVFTHDIRWYERFLWNRMEDFSTLLLGETGTGKGAAAAAIGRSGFIPYDEKRERFAESFTRNFIAINLSQYPEALIESELFGHKKGAFTGAIDHHQGIFSRCSPHGAIFLDEIGDVSIPVQIKLLQILQERTFSPVGSHEKLRFHGRVIAATNRPLDALRQRGEFREDFFYRLCSDLITLPPLRQRLQEEPREIEILLGHVVRRIVGEHSAELAADLRGILARHPGPHYPWPGNVRELEQAVRRILLTRRYAGEQTAPDLTARLHRGIDEGLLDAQELLAGYCALRYEACGTYEEVARQVGLDRRTVKKYIQTAEAKFSEREAEEEGGVPGSSGAMER